MMEIQFFFILMAIAIAPAEEVNDLSSFLNLLSDDEDN